MSEARKIIENAKKIKERLNNPPNAVVDKGIDLTRRSSGQKGNMPYQPREYINHPSSEIILSNDDCMKTYIGKSAGIFPVNFEEVVTAVSTHTQISSEAIKSDCRTKDIVNARRIAIFLAIKFIPNKSMSSIARELNKDHTSILYARNKILEESSFNYRLMNTISEIEEKIIARHSY